MYTYQTINNAERRFAFKRKVFELAQKKNIPIDKMTKLLTFVNDFMLLPQALEYEFQFESTSFSNFLINDMVHEIEPHTESTLEIINAFILKTTGKTIAQYRKEGAAIDARIKSENEAHRKTRQVENLFRRSETRSKQREKRLEAQAEEERTKRVKAEEERTKAEEEITKAEQKRVKAEAETIFNLHSKAGLSMETIALTVNVELEYVKKVIDERLAKE